MSEASPAETQQTPKGAADARNEAIEGVPSREQFLQHALGTQGDVRLPAFLLTVAAMLAVLAVGLKKWKQRRARRSEAGEL